jgi:hypothetical protein
LERRRVFTVSGYLSRARVSAWLQPSNAWQALRDACGWHLASEPRPYRMIGSEHMMHVRRFPVGQQIGQALVFRFERTAAGGPWATKTRTPRHVSSFVRATSAFPPRGNSRSPSPSFCSPVIEPLNLSSAAATACFEPSPCAGRWKVPGLGSRIGVGNLSAGSRSLCMAGYSPSIASFGGGIFFGQDASIIEHPCARSWTRPTR